MALFDFAPTSADFNSAGKAAVGKVMSTVCPHCKGRLSPFKSHHHKKMMMGCKKCNKCVSRADTVTSPKDFARPSWWPYKGMSRKTFDPVAHKTLADHLGNRESKLLGANKSLHKGDNGDIHVKLHNTHVVTAHPNGDYTLRTGGYHSKTTNRVISGVTGLKTNMKGGLIRGETNKPIEDGDLASAHRTPPKELTPQERNPQHYGEEPTLFERGQQRKTYEIQTSKWGKVTYTFAGLTDFSGTKRVMLDNKEHGKASMALDKFKTLFADFATDAPPSYEPIAAAPPPKLLESVKMKPAETTQVLHSNLLPAGSSKPNIVRPPVEHQSRKGSATKNANLTESNPDFEKNVQRLSNHMASMYSRAQDPTAAIELPAFHDSFEHVYRQPGMVTKAAFAKAFPHMVQGNEGYPADHLEAASRYQRAVGEHLYKRRGNGKEGTNVDKQEAELSHEPDQLNLGANLERIRGFEKLHKRPWIQNVLKNLENSHPNDVHGVDHPEGFTPYKERLDKLKAGQYSPRQLRRLLQKLHTPIGSVTLEQLYQHVLPNLGYQVPTSDSPDNARARMQGAITPSARDAMLASHGKVLPEDAWDKGYTDDKNSSTKEEKRGIPEAIRAEALRAQADRLYREAQRSNGAPAAAKPALTPSAPTSPGAGVSPDFTQRLAEAIHARMQKTGEPYEKAMRHVSIKALAKDAAKNAPGLTSPAAPVSTNSSISPVSEPPEEHKSALQSGAFNVNGTTYAARHGGRVITVRGKPYVFFMPTQGSGDELHIPLDKLSQFIREHHTGSGANFDDIFDVDFDADFDLSVPGVYLEPALIADFVEGNTDAERVKYLVDKGYSPESIHLTLKEHSPQNSPTTKTVRQILKSLGARPRQKYEKIGGYRMPQDVATEINAKVHEPSTSPTVGDPNVEKVMDDIAVNHFRDNLRRELLLRHLPEDQKAQLHEHLPGTQLRNKMDMVEDDLRKKGSGILSKKHLDSYLDSATASFIKSHRPKLSGGFLSGVKGAASSFANAFKMQAPAVDKSYDPERDRGGFGAVKVGNPYTQTPATTTKVVKPAALSSMPPAKPQGGVE